MKGRDMLEFLLHLIQAILIVGLIGFIFGFAILISFTDALDYSSNDDTTID